MEPQKIISVGGREFVVSMDGDEVLLAWKDVINPGSDALFTREDAVSLGLVLIAGGAGGEVRPETLESIAHHLESGATTMMRPESRTHAEWHEVATLLRRLASRGEAS